MSAQFLAWLTAVSFACANVTVGHGMRYSTPLTAFVSLTSPIWTALLGAIFLRQQEKLTTASVLALVR